MTDLQEFLAGTDPTNGGSILRVFTLTRLNGGSTTVFWNAVSGKRYRVQIKNGIGDSTWTSLPETVTAHGDTASLTDNSGVAAERFYRVLLVQ